MAEETKTAQPTKTPNGTPTDPNIHFYQWLNDNNYKVSVEALTEETPFLAEKGFVLTDKPLLVVSIKKKGDN